MDGATDADTRDRIEQWCATGIVILRRHAQPRGLERGKHRVYRLYKEECLALKKRPQRKRKAVRHREERFIATAPNQAWSTDFVADQLQDGNRWPAR